MKKTIHTKEQIDAAIAVIVAELRNLGEYSSLHTYSSGNVHIYSRIGGEYFADFESALNAPPPPSAADLLREEIAEKQAELAKLEGNQ